MCPCFLVSYWLARTRLVSCVHLLPEYVVSSLASSMLADGQGRAGWPRVVYALVVCKSGSSHLVTLIQSRAGLAGWLTNRRARIAPDASLYYDVRRLIPMLCIRRRRGGGVGIVLGEILINSEKLGGMAPSYNNAAEITVRSRKLYLVLLQENRSGHIRAHAPTHTHTHTWLFICRTVYTS